jgi:hypothetical protein
MPGVMSPLNLKESDFPDSIAEYTLYRSFNEIVINDEWIVLYDVWQENHVSQAHGQHDYVIMVPSYGILIMEVKGSSIRLNDQGNFQSFNRGKNRWVEISNPYKQAKENAYSLIKDMDYYTKAIRKNPLITWCVAFPEMNEWITTTEWKEHRLFINDHKGLRVNPDNLKKFVLRCLEIQRVKIEQSANSRDGFLSFDNLSFVDLKQFCNGIRKIDRLEFDKSRDTDYKDLAFGKLLESSFGGLSLLGVNDRLYFKGAAGTGKTWLLLKLVLSELQNGRECVLISYSAELLEWINNSVKKEFSGANIVLHAVSRTNSNMLNFAELKSNIEKVESSIFIDEAQDVLCLEKYCTFLKQLTSSIIPHKLRVFADPEKQGRWNDDSKLFDDFIESKEFENHTKILLNKNLRNSKRVFDRLSRVLHDSLSQVEPNNILGEKEVKVVYQTQEDLDKSLLKLLENHKSSGVLDHRITILTLSEKAIEHIMRSFDGLNIRRLSENNSFLNMSGITLAQVHDFKGLENDYIILYGIDKPLDKIEKELYVGISRARIGLSLMFKMTEYHSYLKILS